MNRYAGECVLCSISICIECTLAASGKHRISVRTRRKRKTDSAGNNFGRGIYRRRTNGQSTTKKKSTPPPKGFLSRRGQQVQWCLLSFTNLISYFFYRFPLLSFKQASKREVTSSSSRFKLSFAAYPIPTKPNPEACRGCGVSSKAAMNFTSRVFSLFSTTTTTAAASSPSSSSDTPASQDSSSRQQQQQSLSNGGFRSMAAAVAGGVEDYDDNGGGGDGGQRQIGNIVEGEEAQMQAPMRSMEEEESRPPYLHVCILLFLFIIILLTALRVNWREIGNSVSHFVSLTNCPIQTMTGNVCRRYWRNLRRHAHAFARYGQDTAARRSPYSSQVYLHGRFVCDYISTGGTFAWTLRRCDSRPYGLFSRYRYLLWCV